MQFGTTKLHTLPAQAPPTHLRGDHILPLVPSQGTCILKHPHPVGPVYALQLCGHGTLHRLNLVTAIRIPQDVPAHGGRTSAPGHELKTPTAQLPARPTKSLHTQISRYHELVSTESTDRNSQEGNTAVRLTLQ